MFNNTFQAILLLITFTIRRKISSTQTLETAAQASVSPFHRWTLGSAQDVLDSATAEEPPVLGAVSATRALNVSSTGACALLHHLRWHRKADVCY